MMFEHIYGVAIFIVMLVVLLVIDFIRNQYISTVTGFYSDTLAKNDRVPQR